MSERWLPLGPLAEMKFDPGMAFRVEDRWIAVFETDDGYRALDNACPHAGAPLCDGHYDRKRGTITCGLHLWDFDVATGKCDVGEEWNVQTYPVREVDGALQIQLPAATD